MKKFTFFLMAIAASMAGCVSPDSPPSRVPEASPAITIDPHGTEPVETTPPAPAPDRCEKTGTPLQSRQGYTFPDNVIPEPTLLYAEFIKDNHNYPNATPWTFSPEPVGACDIPVTVLFCPECDKRLQDDFLLSQQLSPEAKQHFLNKLKGIATPVPPAHRIYVVRAGDTGSHIAQRYNMAFAELNDLNPGVRWNRLRIGQQLKIRDHN